LEVSSLKDTPIALGAQADVFAWEDGKVLKLFKEPDASIPGIDLTAHASELSANRVASALGLPVPAVIGGLVEVGGREGMIMERIDGPTMGQYLADHPKEDTRCASLLADLHLQMHQKEVPAEQRVDLDGVPSNSEVSGIPEHRLLLSLFLNLAKDLPADTRDAVLETLDQLPPGTALCHGDFHPGNVIMGPGGPVVIDWSGGVWGNSLADLARTWFLSHIGWWPGALWSRPHERDFWQAYFSRYKKLRPYPEDEFIKWQIVWTAAGIFTNNQSSPPALQFLLDLIHAGLKGETHPWMT